MGCFIFSTVDFGFNVSIDPVTISPSGSSMAGETYSLTCSATLFDPIPLPSDVPSPTFEWFIDNASNSLPSGVTPTATASSSNSTSITYMSTLQFTPLRQFHAGNYICRLGAGQLVKNATVSVNSMFNTRKFNYSQVTIICYLLVPTVSVQITTSGTPGQNGYSLTCGVNGAENLNPSVTYQWIKNSGTQTKIQVGSGVSLTFSPLRLSDMGEYVCEVTISSPYLTNVITVMNTQEVVVQSES